MFVKGNIEILKQNVNNATIQINDLELEISELKDHIILVEENMRHLTNLYTNKELNIYCNNDYDWIEDLCSDSCSITNSSITNYTNTSYSSMSTLTIPCHLEVNKETESEAKDDTIVTKPRTRSIGEVTWIELTKNMLFR
jgi:hypothetical protein